MRVLATIIFRALILSQPTRGPHQSICHAKKRQSIGRSGDFPFFVVFHAIGCNWGHVDDVHGIRVCYMWVGVVGEGLGFVFGALKKKSACSLPRIT